MAVRSILVDATPTESARHPALGAEAIKDARPADEVRASPPPDQVQESATRQAIAAIDGATLKTVRPPRRKPPRPALEVKETVKADREPLPIQPTPARIAPAKPTTPQIASGRLAPAAGVARVLRTLKPKPAADVEAVVFKVERGPSPDVTNDTKTGEPILAAAVAPTLALSNVTQAADSAPAFQGAALGNAAPRYPYAARVRGVEGDVLLRVVVLPNGKAVDVTLRITSGSALLDRAARDAVRRWRFRPARRAGQTVVGWVDVPVSFRLTD